MHIKTIKKACLADDLVVSILSRGSGAGTNLKVGAPVQSKVEGGHQSGAKRRNFFYRAPPLFGYKSTISRFGERFRDGQYSLLSFLFAVLLLTVPPRAQPFVNVGARSPCPMESSPLLRGRIAM